MIYSFLHLFTVSTLGASAFAVGLLEGAAESTALVVKVFSGTLIDYLGRRKSGRVRLRAGYAEQAALCAGADPRRCAHGSPTRVGDAADQRHRRSDLGSVRRSGNLSYWGRVLGLGPCRTGSHPLPTTRRPVESLSPDQSNRRQPVITTRRSPTRQSLLASSRSTLSRCSSYVLGERRSTPLAATASNCSPFMSP